MNNVLKELRQQKGCKHKEMSEALGVSISQLSDYENGRKKLGMSMAIKLADYYNVSLDYIMGREVVQELDNRTDIERIVSDNHFSDADEEILKQGQENLVRILKQKQSELEKKQSEIDKLRKENQELRAKYE